MEELRPKNPLGINGLNKSSDFRLSYKVKLLRYRTHFALACRHW